jgi:hypothetical protein
MRLSIAILLALIGASLLAPCEAVEIYAPLEPKATKVAPPVITVIHDDGDYDVVTERSGRVPGIERKLSELESEWRRLNRRSHIDYKARQRANALSVQIVSLRKAIGTERSERVSADQWERTQREAGDINLSGRINNEAQARRTGDEDNMLLTVCLCGILLVGLAYVATSR